jgi:hypothetical protein
MSESLETILRLVSEGRITAEEADRILSALDADRESAEAPSSPSTTPRGRPRYVRIEVMENGEPRVNVRLPASLGELAMRRIPGIARPEVERIQEAIRTGSFGPIVSAQDDTGNSVRIVVE